MNVIQTLPRQLYVACSGGVDSVAAAAFLSERRSITLLHFSHADHACAHELSVVEELARTLSVKLITSCQSGRVDTNREAAWRDARYNWFHSLDKHVVTGHTLDDVVSWYLMTCIRGEGQIMEYSNKNVIRPFLLTEKRKLIDYALAHNLKWWEDPSNSDVNFTERNRVVNNILPEILKINPGFYKTVKRKFLQKKSRDLSIA
jgi:tRNA(Ile)-lysidine synthase